MQSRTIADKLNRLTTSQQDKGESAWRPYICRGIVTATTGGSAPYTVAALQASGASSETTYTPCWTQPPGGTVEVDDIVILWFERQGEAPWILQTGGGNAGARPMVVTAVNGDGTIDCDLLQWDDLSTVIVSYEDIRLHPNGSVVVGDRGWLFPDPAGAGWIGLL